jgi:cell division cycle 2-like protein
MSSRPATDAGAGARAAAGAGAAAGAAVAGAHKAAAAATGAAAAGPRRKLPHNPLWHGCRSVTCYKPLRKIDEGTYGVVFAAQDLETGERVALKKVKMGKISTNEGFPITALRETNVLLMLRHPNIIRVREMVVGRDIDKVSGVADAWTGELVAEADCRTGGRVAVDLVLRR